MLDRSETRAKFFEWVKSPAFNPQVKARFKTPRWPFIGAAICLPTTFLFEESRIFEPMLLVSFVLPLWAYNLWNVTRSKRKAFRQSLDRHEPILCALVIGNKKLIHTKGATAPALLLGSFGAQDEADTEVILTTAAIFASLYGEDPSAVPAELQEASRLVNDDTYQPDRRRQVPPDFINRADLWLFDTMLLADDLPSGTLENPLIPCMASPGPTGTIVQLPPDIPVFQEAPYQSKTIWHQAPATLPPIVAPHSDNLEAVEAHITRHLGEPATVFHELVSTTVHIDVHIVAATRERPWISLVTSGMSDLPMNVPEGSEAFRFAELMIRLPADWKLREDDFKQEENYWPIRNLKFLARFAHECETWLAYGHTIPNGHPPGPIAPGIPFTGFILGLPAIGGKELATLELADGTPVHFWSLIPLHPSEMEFKLKHGADALFKKLDAAGHGDLFHPRRPPVV